MKNKTKNRLRKTHRKKKIFRDMDKVKRRRAKKGGE